MRERQNRFAGQGRRRSAPRVLRPNKNVLLYSDRQDVKVALGTTDLNDDVVRSN